MELQRQVYIYILQLLELLQLELEGLMTHAAAAGQTIFIDPLIQTQMRRTMVGMLVIFVMFRRRPTKSLQPSLTQS
uniref:Uncharacterized protein n=1 Tax=Amphimedon queenslandica TaxID=400682 RepID=A0A1X7VBK2_AMPQE